MDSMPRMHTLIVSLALCVSAFGQDPKPTAESKPIWSAHEAHAFAYAQRLAANWRALHSDQWDWRVHAQTVAGYTPVRFKWDRSNLRFDLSHSYASAWASAEARARGRVAATRARDLSGSRTPPSQQRRSMPSTTALNQSSLEFSEKGLFDQSEFNDVKRLFSGCSGFSVISTSEPAFPVSDDLSAET